MLPLIKIRLTYLKRKKGTLIFSYLLPPVFIMMLIIFLMVKTGINGKPKIIDKQNFTYPIEDDKYTFFENYDTNNFQEIWPYLNCTNFVVKEKDIGIKLINYIQKKTSLNITEYNLYDEENNLKNNSQNVIILDYSKEKEAYSFTFKTKESKISNNYTHLLFKKNDLSTLEASDLFIYDKNYTRTSTMNKNFFMYQELLSGFLIEIIKNKKIENKKLELNLGLNSYPPSVQNFEYYSVYDSIRYYLIGILVSLLAISLSIQMLQEREQKLEQLLERQGIGKFKYILSWFLTFLLLNLLFDITYIVGIIYSLQSLHILSIFSLILFNIAQFSLIIFIVNITNNLQSGTILSFLIIIGSFIIGPILVTSESSKFIQVIFNFFPIVNLFNSFQCTVKLQYLGKMSLDNVFLRYNKISYMETLLMFLVEIIFYSFIGLFVKYFKNSGLSFFDYIKSFCVEMRRQPGKIISPLESNESDKKINHEELNEANKSLKEQNNFLNISNVTRKYDELIAVNNFSGELFKNEIFCLLGHNGAGKTTLIKMISGVEDPDEGDIFLNGNSIITNKNYLYHNIGVCLQDDIFFDYLTVAEQLKYILEIRGEKGNQDQVNNLINRIGLTIKRDAICKTLSGGEKRKLCVIMAIIGNSQLVLLDEPTSGMDVISKRELWDFLKEFKNDKIIILTTHSLDEAEYLGDRIGIMTNGRFICSGTSSYIKSRYPCGFNINLLLNSAICDENKKQLLFNSLTKYEPNLEIKISSKGIFSLNIQSNNKNIKEIFDFISNNKEKYGIEDFTVSSTSLEDVFLKLNHKISINDNDDEIEIESRNSINEVLELKDEVNLTFSTSFGFQLISHIKRGIFLIWRKKWFLLLELIYGLFLLYIYVVIFKFSLDDLFEKSVDLIELLNENNVLVCKDDETFLKKSYVYDIGSFKFDLVDKKNKMQDFIDEIYDKALGNIAKSGICFESKNPYNVINSEIPISKAGYIMADSMLIVSSYLKNEFDINAVIGNKIILSTIINSDNSILQISIMFSLCFGLVMSWVIYLGTIMADKIKERVQNIKHILYLSGTNMISYWLGFYIVDIFKMLIFSCLLAPIIYIIGDYASYMWLNCLILIPSSLLFIYVISFFFDKEDNGKKGIFLIFFILLEVIASFIMILKVVNKNLDLSFLINKYNYTILDLIPILSFTISSLRLGVSYILFNAYYISSDEVPFPGLGNIYRPKAYLFTSMLSQAIDIVIYLLLLLLIESGLIEKFFNYIKVKYLIKDSNISFSNIQITEEFLSNNNISSNTPLLQNIPQNNLINEENTNLSSNNKKDYIQSEMDKINSDAEGRLTTKIIALKKTYWICCKKNIRAINNLYLGLDNNEKFGLLGFNGSGKTTTFKSITKEILYDSGSIFIFGKNNKTQFDEIRQFIGYCPQSNPLFDYMKVKEIIKFFLSLKGRHDSVENICKKFGIEKYMETYCINLSGGNKRKVSFAIALMSNPKLLLLDEPSTGVDPESRRVMWKNIMETTKKNNKFNMILTTHSMEEAEVLCDTVSWLKSGNFLSIGNPEKLKIQLSAGYKLHIKFIQLNQNEGSNYDNVIDNLSNNINGFNILYQNMEKKLEIKPYLIELNNVINEIKDNCNEIRLLKINKDYSFEFNVHMNKEKQSELFSQVLNMKNINKQISEISISMESLENILTQL